LAPNLQSYPLRFYTHFHLVKLLGLKAKNPAELLDGLRTVPGSSIYYHTHRFLKQHQFLYPEPPNDFAYWLINVLNMDGLGEAFASIATVSFNNIETLRAAYLDIIASHLKQESSFPNAPKGEEFQFMTCQTFCLPTPYLVHNLAEFRDALENVSIHSLFYHVFESRIRLGNEANDFSTWLENIGEPDLAREVARIDPYCMTLEKLRQKLIGMVAKYEKH
jgi:hypothetical protein